MVRQVQVPQDAVVLDECADSAPSAGLDAGVVGEAERVYAVARKDGGCEGAHGVGV